MIIIRVFEITTDVPQEKTMQTTVPPLRLALMASAVLAFNSALAQQGRADEGAGPLLEEVTVWGTQVRSSSVNLQDETIAIRQADHISDLLRTIPGVDVGGAHSLNQRIIIRSLGDRNLRVWIDGANQNSYMYHHMGNLQIHADILRSVDIEVGTNSVINGGLGGAIRFETRDARHLLEDGQQFGLRVQGSVADNAAQGYALTGFGQLTDSVDALGYYHFLDRDNYEVGGGKIEDRDGNEIPGTDGEVKGLEGELENVLLKFGWDFADNQRLQFGYEGYTDEGDYSYRPDMGLATDISIGDNLGLPLTYPTEFTRDTFTLNYELQWGAASSLTAAVYANDSTLWRDERAINAIWPEDPAIVEGRAENTGFSLLGYSTLGDGMRHQLTYGADVIDYETEYKPDGQVNGGEEATSAAVFLEDRIEFGSGLALIPGLRYDHWDMDAQVTEDRFSGVSGALAGEWAVTDSLLLKLSTTQLFQAPELAEVFIGAGVNDLPNPGIDEQRGQNSELSLAYESSVLGADRLAAGFTVFDTDIDDYIYEYATSPAGGYWKDNVGDMSIEGVEAYLGYDLGNLRTLLTYSSAESDLSAAADYTELDGARIDREQGDTISLNVDYVFAAIDLALHWDMLWVDDLGDGADLDGATLDNSKDGYSVHNLSARWTPKRLQGLALTVGVDNLFDEYYASQSSRTGVSFHPRFGELQLTDYEPGRNLKATVSYQF
ncbi:MAG: TonB-dependent siderophore receptor [Halioglobus sp.]